MWNIIVNPKTGKKVNVNSKLGKSILRNYMKQLGGVKNRDAIDIRGRKARQRKRGKEPKLDEERDPFADYEAEAEWIERYFQRIGEPEKVRRGRKARQRKRGKVSTKWW